MSTPVFLSAASANALISDLRPTTLSAPALHHINSLIDEVLSLLVTHAESINPTHIRLRGIPAVFSGDKSAGETTGPRALGRSAVAEAELELRSWYESHPGGKKGAFVPDGQGTGVKSSRPSFPVREATELLKLRCVSFSTLAPSSPPPKAYEEQIISAWQLVGGDTSEETLSPAGLWMTAILEHVCEHVLGQLARVVARDSSIAVAGVQDLYVALCEDESIWGLFKRLQVKSSLEFAIKNGTRQRRTTPVKHALHHSFGGTSINTSSSKSSLPPSGSARDVSLEQSRLAASTPVEHIRESSDRHRGPVQIGRKVSSGTARTATHQRSASLLSANTKSAIAAFNEQYGNDTDQSLRNSQDEDEFDALVRSGETMKVSLTPSRLKTFESPNRRSPASPTQAQYVRTLRPTQSPEVPEMPPLTPSSGVINRESPRKFVAPRTYSSPRLVARNAATIKEDDDEQDEELMDGPSPKKESLAEMFAAESRQSSRKSSGSSGKRTVPAVVLGSPPPRQSSLPSSPPSTVRKTKRHDLTVETNDDDLMGHRKPRSEAQELADFFNSTQPPGGVTAPVYGGDQRGDEPPKSAKSFKSFMSRMTGKKKDQRGSVGSDVDRPPMPSSFSSQGLAGLVKRQKSTTSFASSTVATDFGSQPPSARPYPEPLSAAGSAARQPPNEPMTTEKMGAIGVAAMTMGSGMASHAVSPEKRMNGLRVGTVNRNGTPIQERGNQHEVSESDVEASVPEPSRPADSPTIGESESAVITPQPRAGRSALATNGSSTEEYVVVDRADAQPTPIDTSSYNTPAEVATTPSPVKPTPSTASHLQFPSEAASFRTADEGSTNSQSPVDDEEVAEQEGEDAQDEVRDITHMPRRDTLIAPLPPPPAPSSPPSIPLADLVPLRGLLRHATTARECQLLLGAILSQLGVPLGPSEDQTIDPESRVTAWLLAGREGPTDYPSPTTRSGTTITAEESIATPTMTVAELREASTVEHHREEQEEELAAEVNTEMGDKGSETTSMARTSISAIDSVPEVKEAGTGQWTEAVHVPVSQGAR